MLKRVYFLLSIALIITALMVGCQKEESPTEDKPKEDLGKIVAKVHLPDMSTIVIENLLVLSPTGESRIEKDYYSIDTFGLYKTSIVTNDKGDIVLMGYYYPGQDNADITVKSTVLALIMNSPIVSSLTTEGKQSLISQLLNGAGFKKIVDLVEKSIIDNGFFRTNTEIASAVNSLFTDLSNRALLIYRPVPINITTSGKLVSLVNNRVAHSYVAGLYKKGSNQRITKVVLQGTPYFASSIFEAFRGVWLDGYNEPDQKIIELPTPGEYSLKIRSGKPTASDNSTEFQEARLENISMYLLETAIKYIPIPNECFGQVKSNIVSYAYSGQDWTKVKSASELGLAMVQMNSLILENVSSIVSSCASVNSKTELFKYLKALGKVFKYFDLIGKTGEVLNIGAYVHDLYNSRASIDTCFTLNNNSIVPCNDSAQLYMENIAGKWKIEHHHNSLYFGWVLMETDYVEAFSDGSVYKSKYVLHDQKDQYGKIYPGKTVLYDPPIASPSWGITRSANGNYFINFSRIALTFPVTSMVSGDTSGSIYASKYLYSKGW